MQKINFISNFFFELLLKHCQLMILVTLAIFDNLHHMKTSYFRCYEHTWLHTPKMIKLTWRKLWYLSACQKQTLLFTSFLRYFISKNRTIWLPNIILPHKLRTRIALDMRLAMKHQWQYYFLFYIISRNK